MSLGLQIFKVIGDFVLIKAPYPPVVKAADYPTECAAFAAENKRNTSAMAIRNAATAGRLISRFFVGLRLMSTFIKVARKRRHNMYLQTATIWEMCGGASLNDVDFRLSQRPWEIGQADDFGMYPVHYAAMNENEAAPDILEALLKSNRFAAQVIKLNTTLNIGNLIRDKNT
jgi:hypothetical protein